MKAIAVIPGQANSIHLAELPKPSVHDVPNGRGVLVQVLRVGVDGTDKEINAAEHGQVPPGYDFLVTGHECFGLVLEAGSNVTEFMPGDYEFSVPFDGRYYSIRKYPVSQGMVPSWNQEAFAVLSNLFQMTVTDLTKFPTPAIAIAK